MTAPELKRRKHAAESKQRLDAFLLKVIRERSRTHPQIRRELTWERFGRVTNKELSAGLQRLRNHGKIRNNANPQKWMVN